MPVLLTREEEFQTWLKGSPDEAFALAREYPPEQMRLIQTGYDKEDLLGLYEIARRSRRVMGAHRGKAR